MKNFSRSEIKICPHCGEYLSEKDKVCPACGSDYQTGWSDDAVLDRLGLPREMTDEEYELAVQEILSADKKSGTKNLILALIALLVILSFLLVILRF